MNTPHSGRGIYQLLSGKVDDHIRQIESASKYPYALVGDCAAEPFQQCGTVDNADIPSIALWPARRLGGSFGGTLRQSQIAGGVRSQVAGARTTADLQLDLGGGFPQAPNGVNVGLLRLRTGTMRLDWAHTSIVAGQDALFFSPVSRRRFPRSQSPHFRMQAICGAGSTGPCGAQIYSGRRFEPAGPGEFLIPEREPPIFDYYRTPQAGERSRQPAYATRMAWSHSLFGQPLRVGVAGYYGRQSYGFKETWMPGPE